MSDESAENKLTKTKPENELTVDEVMIETRQRAKSDLSPDAKYKLAFIVMVITIGSGFVGSNELSRYVEIVRKAAGNEPADLMIKVFLRTRSSWMQEFMG